ncbi:bifunctional diaminohydroxyphosphoribosylaminopyrimidine deaminase/5-amino-6-(5-phosphoribosylamino)uracil reductase RibD [Aliiroseovarius lamellibrachiae]|uniref:bifunctional diaminohydroxyphosphoribosylaminopyrimidine deaminase/5-amino-6-(5-phosphoribosylamino)uracil reductase RibD n=1 Tax=Aliiroseovarius lamellibrachiae TaxID=1924933 RepID=UPI001BE12775|nr:bifunctional diaminohydroxyphosphoribosylaminopyrimidine deaminase/5-amino-6-(5-phosphoribosylamino)uracil reductase RibD [Aliiroseovarius lamellibrachiae]MBT2130963.1 bifunctional diaminohydroxyphosphoribosylaminopyrimidine deaminase/5-amino-6-(5-phosphoribosylamino)uracil reductase RibD [Aliiroseovarius lamellibrachiae]
MRLALSLGRRGQGRCAPNPAVGCVVVKDARIIGRGWTQPGGRPHGEVMALAQAGIKARGATAYVTLEPCAHHGQTPPCAQALIDAGIARVVVALGDPDPRVDGGGHAMLRAAGIEVSIGVCAEEAARDHAGFLLKTTETRPFVTLKLANSFDGRIATATGESQWITGPEARRYVHALRARHDAVMVGAGTARDDDPTLTVRDLGVTHQPTRIVLSRQLDLPLSGKLAAGARDVPVIICHGPHAPKELLDVWRDLGAQMVSVSEVQGALSPASVLNELGKLGLTRVFCEGGGGLAASLLKAGLVDELVGFTAGLVLGAEGRASVAAMGVNRLAVAPRFALIETRALGGDVLHRWARR